MGRSTTRSAALDEMFDQAERLRQCAQPTSRNETQAMYRRVKAGELIRPAPHLYARASTWKRLPKDERSRWVIRTIAHNHPGTVFCLYSAAVMYRLPVSYRNLGHIHICTDKRHPSGSSTWIIRHAYLDDPVTRVEGVQVTYLVQTVVHCMRTLPFPDALALADALLRKLKIERQLLEEIVAQLAKGMPGYRHALNVASHADGRAESGGESIARGKMIEANLMPSDLQFAVPDPHDEKDTFRVDIVFKMHGGSLVFVEVDGREKYTNPKMLGTKSTNDALIAERNRESRLSALGIPIVRFTMQEIWTPGVIEARLAVVGITPDTLAPGDYRDTAQQPPRPEDYVTSLNQPKPHLT